MPTWLLPIKTCSMVLVHRWHIDAVDQTPYLNSSKFWTSNTQRQDALYDFLQNLSSKYPVKFTWSHSAASITSLDVDIHVGSSIINTSVYIKPTNTLQYHHFTNCYPDHTKSSHPYSLVLRGACICSTLKSLATYTNWILNSFINRNSPTDLLQKQISSALSNIQTSLQITDQNRKYSPCSLQPTSLDFRKSTPLSFPQYSPPVQGLPSNALHTTATPINPYKRHIVNVYSFAFLGDIWNATRPNWQHIIFNINFNLGLLKINVEPM